MSDITLLPCPFCGGPASIVKNSFPPRNRWRHPSCDNHECPGFVQEQDEQGGTNCDFLTDAEAAECWNKRAEEVRTPRHDPETVARINRMVDDLFR